MFKVNMTFNDETGEATVFASGKVTREELAMMFYASINSLAHAVDLTFDDLFCKIYNLGKEYEEDAEH